MTRVDAGEDRIEAIARCIALIQDGNNLAQLFAQTLGKTLVVIDVFLRSGISSALDQDSVGYLLRSNTLLAHACDVIEEEGLKRLDRFFPVDLQRAFRLSIDLAFACFVGFVVHLTLGFNGGQACIDPARVLFIVDSFIKKLPETDQVISSSLNLVF